MSNKTKALIYITITTILFSTVEIALKSVSNQFNPIQITFTRFFIGGIVLLPIAIYRLKTKGIKLELKNFLYLAFLGFICVTLSMTFYQLAIFCSNASVVAVLFSGNPVFVIFLAYIFLNESFSIMNIIALIFEIVGIIVIIDPLNVKLDFFGVTFCIMAILLFSFYVIFGKKTSIKYGGIVVTSISFIFGSIELMILCTLTHINVISSFLSDNNLNIISKIPFFEGFTWENLPMVLYISVVLTGIGFAFYFLGMEKMSSIGGSIVFFIKPALASLFAYIIIKETIPTDMILGIVIILIGSLITIYDVIKSKNQKQF